MATGYSTTEDLYSGEIFRGDRCTPPEPKKTAEGARLSELMAREIAGLDPTPPSGTKTLEHKLPPQKVNMLRFGSK